MRSPNRSTFCHLFTSSFRRLLHPVLHRAVNEAAWTSKGSLRTSDRRWSGGQRESRVRPQKLKKRVRTEYTVSTSSISPYGFRGTNSDITLPLCVRVIHIFLNIIISLSKISHYQPFLLLLLRRRGRSATLNHAKAQNPIII